MRRLSLSIDTSLLLGVFTGYLFGAFPYVADAIARRGATLSSASLAAWNLCSYSHSYNWILWCGVLILGALEIRTHPLVGSTTLVCKIAMASGMILCMLLLGGVA
jgi:hypothetical protein